MEKLTIEQLKNYLGTGLKVTKSYSFKNGTERKSSSIIDDPSVGYLLFSNAYNWIKPHCYRLSDLDKFIPELGFVPLKRLVNDNPNIDKTIEIDLKERKLKSISSFEVTAWIDYESGESRKEHIISFYPFGNQGMTPFKFIDQLCNWHFWIFDQSYFDKGLIIDKLTYK